MKTGPVEPDRAFCCRRGTETFDRLKRAASSFLFKQLVNKENRLANELAAGGNRGVAGTVNTAEANFLGERFVGEGFTERVGPHGERILISKDGLRQYRSPTSKLSEHATTGRQANFQSRSAAEGAWENNVHFHIED
jgi:hypothetical protein